MQYRGYYEGDGYRAHKIKEGNVFSVLRCSPNMFIAKKRVRAKIPLPTNLLSGVGGESNALYPLNIISRIFRLG